MKGSDTKLLLDLNKKKPKMPKNPGESSVEKHRRESAEKSRKRQDVQAEQMKKMQLSSSTAKVGDIVSLKMDYRDVTHPRGVYGIVFDVHKGGAGGVKVVTQYGVIVSGKSKKPFWVPSDRYLILDQDVVLSSEKLQTIKAYVSAGTFLNTDYPKTTMQNAHVKYYGQSPGGRTKCGCKKGSCSSKCGCIRKGVACNSSCACGGGCQNANNGV